MNRETIVVWFSCGAASAVAAKKTVEQFGKKYNIRVVNNPVIEEDSDNRRFLKDVEKWIGVKIEFAINYKYPACSAAEIWEERRFMAGHSGAPCTTLLKKVARQQFEMDNDIDWHVLGFVAGEEARFNRFVHYERKNTLPVLIEQGITKKDCFEIIHKAGILLPKMYRMGYPNANCIGCVKASSPTYWNHVRKQHPEIFRLRAKQSRKIGAKLVRVKGKRIFLDELSPQAKGRPMKNLEFECGIFCYTG